MNWAMKTAVFDDLDDFVIQHNYHYKWLKELHAEIRFPLFKPIIHHPYVIKKRFGNWRDKVVDWYNDWADKGFKQAKNHLYLYGPPDSGKTNLVQFLLGINEKFYSFIKFLKIYVSTFLEPYRNQIFCPKETGRYFLEGFNQTLSTMIIIDRTDMANFCTEKWRELVAEDLFLIEHKYQDSFPEILQSPIIFISNFPPPNSDYQNPKINKIFNRPTRIETVHCQNENGL